MYGFVMTDGGKLFKIRIPLPKNNDQAPESFELLLREVNQMLKKALTILSFCLVAFTSMSHAAIIEGNPKGNVTLLEAFDYQCPRCQSMYPIIQAITKANSNLKVALMPVAILGKLSLAKASAAIAATMVPGKFTMLNAILMTRPPQDQQALTKVLKDVGLGNAHFLALMHRKFVERQLLAGLNLLKQNKTGVPLILIYPSNHPDKVLTFIGETSQQRLQAAIDHVAAVK